MVDFQRAINEVKEGIKAKEKLDAMYAQRQQQMSGLEQQLQTKYTEYEQQKALLSDSARAQREQELMELQGQAQQLAYQAEMEMQEAYAKEMEALIVKMRDIAVELQKPSPMTWCLKPLKVVWCITQIRFQTSPMK